MDHPVKQLRRALGMTQEEFARAVGIHRTRISQVEHRPNHTLGSKTAIRIADVYRAELVRLGITVEDLIRGSRGRAA